MKLKKGILLLLSVLLVFPSFYVHATENNSVEVSEEGSKEQLEREVLALKDEVIYAALDANGVLDEVYVVNIFDVIAPGVIVDYGLYSSVRNLTDLSPIEQEGKEVRISVEEGKFYYQGNMSSRPLPWEVAVTYYMDGENTAPESLPGRDGRFELRIETKGSTQEEDRSFFENYLLQVSVTVPAEKFRNIQAPDGMISNAGKNKQITFTVMPGEQGNLYVSADVIDLEMSAIDIAAVPPNMAFDVDVNGMTDDVKTLADAIQDINDGVRALREGVSEITSGARAMRDGSGQYKSGMEELDSASSELVEASAMIHEQLGLISQSLTDGLGDFDFSEWDLSGLEQLPEGLTKLSDVLGYITDGLGEAQENYQASLRRLDEVISSLPEYHLTEKEIQKLYDSGADREVIDRLLETYYVSLEVRETYETIRKYFDNVEEFLLQTVEYGNNVEETLAEKAKEMEAAFDNMSMLDYIIELEQGLQEFANHYGQFHEGLVGYTDGVSELSAAYGEIHSGIDALAGGTAELHKGVGELEAGTTELADATRNMPEEMQKEMDKMLAEYDWSDFEPISWVSPNNENINNVQFVIRTESIKKDSDNTGDLVVEEPKGFWAKLIHLFSNILS